jgi:hypothetical protein
MEAWILHIEEKWFSREQDKETERSKNTYTAWATEQQAWRAGGAFLLENKWSDIFNNRHALEIAIESLVEVGKIKEAIQLINEYANAEKELPPNPSTRNRAWGCHISINKSTFSGSPFE